MGNFKHPGIRSRVEAKAAALSNRDLIIELAGIESALHRGGLNGEWRGRHLYAQAILREATWRLQSFVPENQS